jgi:hypothetical protein
MADQQTPNLGLTKIEIAGSEDTWGDKLNDNADKIDQFVATKTEVSTGLAGKADTSHTHTTAQVTGLDTALAAKAPLASPALTGTPTAPTAAPGTNTTQLATTGFVTAGLGTKANATHTHAIADVTGLQAALDGKQAAGSYAPATHTHTTAQVTGLDTQLAGKANATHTHAIADVTGLQAALDAKAPLASPAFTGNPTAPTPAQNDNDTSIATTAFVQTAITAATGGKADLDSPALTGNPTAPTPPDTDDDTSIATTAFVNRAKGISTPTFVNTATVTPALADIGKTLRLGSSVANVSIPNMSTVAWPWGARIDFLLAANTTVNFAAAGGGTLSVKASKLARLTGQWSACTILCIDTTAPGQWVIIGDLVDA